MFTVSNKHSLNNMLMHIDHSRNTKSDNQVLRPVKLDNADLTSLRSALVLDNFFVDIEKNEKILINESSAEYHFLYGKKTKSFAFSSTLVM